MLNLIKLENRIVLDGAMGGDAKEHHDAEHHALSVGDSSFVPGITADTDHIAGAAALLTDTATASESLDVILIADSLPDVQKLADSAKPGAYVIIYDAEHESAADVVERVMELSREQNREVDSLTIFSHGGSGVFHLGNEAVTAETLESNTQAWEHLNDAMTDKGRIWLFGCNTANNEGQSLLQRLGAVTGTTVFASDDSTGADGDWDLEVSSEGPNLHKDAPPVDTEHLADYSASLDSAPTISGTPSDTVNQGGTYYFKPQAADSDVGDTLTFSISKQPSWASFNAATGELTGTPGNADVGTHKDIVISVTDITGLTASLPAFSINVENVNDAPTISGTSADSVQEGKSYNFTPTAGDIDLPYGDNLTFSIVNKPSWANFDAKTGTLSGTPAHADVGTYSGIVITVTDAAGAKAQISPFAISVENLNTAPTISGTPQTSVNQDASYRFVPTADDADVNDKNQLTFSISKQPSWASFNPKTGELSGTPGHNDVGITTGIVITVTDPSGEKASLPSFDLVVVNVNDPPVVSGTPVTGVQVGKEYSFTPTSKDPDTPYGDTLSFSITNKPAWATFDSNTGKLSGMPGEGDVGTTKGIVITATDSAGEKASLTAFDIMVVKTNQPPVISGTPAETVNQDASYSFTPQASDPDGDIKSFSVSNQPPWASFDSKTGKLTGKPVNADVGIYRDIVISVTDNTGLSASLPAFNILVVNVNDAPTIIGSSTQSVQEGSTYTFTPTSKDPDLAVDVNEKLTFKISNKPDWASFDSKTGTLSGTPEAKDIGVTQNIVITVTDVAGASAELQFDLEVVNKSDPPTIAGDPADKVTQDDTYYFKPTAVPDVPGDVLDFSISKQPSWATFDPKTGALTGTPKNADVAVYEDVVITVTDSTGLSASLPAFDITVVNKNDAPEIVGLSAQNVLEGKTYSFTPTSRDPDLPYGDILTFSIANKPEWAGFDSKTGTLSGTPGREDIGTTKDIVVTVTDTGGLKATLKFDLTVEQSNTPPVISGNPDPTVEQDKPYSFTPTAQDAEDTVASRAAGGLTFSISNQPAWATFDSKTGTLSGTPGNDDVGTYQYIEIKVTDSGGLSANLPAFSLTVVNVNDKPDIVSEPQRKVRLGNSYTFTPTDSDVDLHWRNVEPNQKVDPTETLTYSINVPDVADSASLFSWATFNTATGTLSGTPINRATIENGGHVGIYDDISITVTDREGKSDTLTYDLEVILINEPPKVGPQQFVIDEGVPDGTHVGVVSATDEDGYVTKFEVVGGNGKGIFDVNPETGEITVIKGSVLDHNIDYTLDVRVTDNEDATAQATMLIDVLNVRPAIDLDLDNPGGYGDTGQGGPLDYEAVFTEGDPPVNIGDKAVVTDPDSTHLNSVDAKISNVKPDDVLSADTSGTSITAAYNPDDGTLHLTGYDTIANYQKVIRTTTFFNPSDAIDDTERPVQFVATDTDGHSSAVATCWVTVIAVNDPPENHLPAAPSTPENTDLVFSDAQGNRIFITDVDAGDGIVETRLTVDSGTLRVQEDTGVILSGNGSSEIVIQGTLSDINRVLDGLTYTPVKDLTGTTKLTITTNDKGNTGTEYVELTDTDELIISVGIHPHHPPEGPAVVPPGEGDYFPRPSLGEPRGVSLGFLYNWGDVKDTGRIHDFGRGPGLYPGCKDVPLYPCCTLEEVIRVGCRFAPSIDPEARICNASWAALGWPEIYLDEEFDLYSSNPNQRHFMREAGDKGINLTPGELAWTFFRGSKGEWSAPSGVIFDNFVQGSKGEFNAAPSELKQSFFAGREALDASSWWGSDAWPRLGSVVPCGDSSVPTTNTPVNASIPSAESYGEISRGGNQAPITEENLSESVNQPVQPQSRFQEAAPPQAEQVSSASPQADEAGGGFDSEPTALESVLMSLGKARNQ